MKLNINNKTIELKYTLRAMIMYENVTSSTFAPKSISDIITLFYCVVVSSAKDYDLSFEQFVDYLDENVNVLNEFSEWLQTVNNTNEQLKKG